MKPSLKIKKIYNESKFFSYYWLISDEHKTEFSMARRRQSFKICSLQVVTISIEKLQAWSTVDWLSSVLYKKNISRDYH